MTDPEPLSAPEPLFDPVRRHHRDVDVVLLPPQPRTPPAPPTTEARASRLADRARYAARACGHLLERTWDVEAELWWRVGAVGEHRFVVRRGLRGLRGLAGPSGSEGLGAGEGGEGVVLLRRLAAATIEEGWVLAVDDLPHPRLRAARGDLVLSAETHHTALDVEIASVTMVLDRATLTGLTGLTGLGSAQVGS